MQLPQPSRVQHRHRALRSTATEHVRRIGADRARRTIGQLDYQQQHAVPSLKRPRRQQMPEQRMRLRDHPHIARQYRTQLLQSVAITPGTGKTHLAIGAGDPGLPSRAPCPVRHRRRMGRPARRSPPRRPPPSRTDPARAATRCIVVDEVGYIPFEPEAANLFFQLVSSRYERASLIVTSNKPFGRWGEVFGDDVVAAAMIDRLVHHAEVIALKGDSYRLKDRDLGRTAAAASHH